MAKFKVTDEVIYKGKHYLVHEVNGNKVKISDWEGDERTVGVNDPDLKALNACARNAVVAKALNSCGTARNGGAENHIGKRFGNVEVSAWDFDGNRHFEFGLGIPFNEPSRTVGKVGSKEYAISKAEESLKRHRQNIADIEKGIAWLKAAK